MTLAKLLAQNPLTAAQVEGVYIAGNNYAKAGNCRDFAINKSINLPARCHHPAAFMLGYDSYYTQG